MKRTGPAAWLAWLALAPGVTAQDVPAADPVRVDEEIVVTASRTETQLQNAPAAMTVISAERLLLSPTPDYAESLRSVPGLNLSQVNARDYNVSGRRATQMTSNNVLLVLDGRPLTLDFVGTNFWDAIPLGTENLQQMEILRGPASVAWGANALSGVVQILSRAPRETAGTHVTLSAGRFGRDTVGTAGADPGTHVNVAASHARVINDRFAFRLSGGYSWSDAFARPAGTVPVDEHPLAPSFHTGGATYPSFSNAEVSHPRISARLDQAAAGGHLTYEGGWDRTKGLTYTPVGPFQLDPVDYSYGRVAFVRGRFQVAGFANILRTGGPNLLSVDASFRPINSTFRTNTYDLSASQTRTVGSRHLLNYGGNLRRQDLLDVSTAPAAKDRNEGGLFFEDQIYIGRFLLHAGSRLDRFANVDGVVLSPRLAVVYRARPDHGFRTSFGRGFRAPTVIENYYDQTNVAGALPLGLIDPAFGAAEFPIVVRGRGDPELDEESTTSWEIGYTGRFAHTTLNLSLYVADSNDVIRLNADPARRPYSSRNPPSGWPLPPVVLDILAGQGILLPAEFQFQNFGTVREKGLELAVSHRLTAGVSAFANYSLQGAPDPLDEGTPPYVLSVQPKHRLNLGITVERAGFVAALSTSSAGRAFWSEPFAPAFWGYSDGYTLVGARLGRRFVDGKVTVSLRATNLLGKEVQQHVFGDVLKRSVTADVTLRP